MKEPLVEMTDNKFSFILCVPNKVTRLKNEHAEASKSSINFGENDSSY